ncbi:MAG: hypothetical protein IKS04_02665 [Clostridia bacterium]|nr:hypothetical protein [Clostridia bacterium]
MKKALSVLLALMMVFSIAVPAFAAEESRTIVYCTIASSKGEFALPNKTVIVSDIDNDGALTINDALYCAHEQYYEGGAAKGYNSYTGQYGLSLGKLWGEENSGSLGYYLNNQMAMGLADPVKDGDFLYAWAYQDAKNWSDCYSFFDKNNVKANSYDTVEITYTYSSGYDDNWQPVFVPCEGAEITVDGVATGVKTDKDGKASVIIPISGEHIISAKAPKAAEGETQVILTPPVCKVTVQFNFIGLLNKIIDTIREFFNGLLEKAAELINPAPLP